MNAEIITIKQFDPLTASREEWVRYHEFRKLKQKEENPNDPISSDESCENSIKANVQYPEADIKLYYVLHTRTNKQIGEFDQAVINEVSPSYEATKHLIQFSIYILPEYRLQGIGSELLKMITSEALKRKKSLLITNTDCLSGKAFLEKIGAQIALAGVENRLLLENIDWSMVEQWVHEGEKRSPTSKIDVFTTIPDEIIEAYCNAYTEVVNQQPLGELDVGQIITTPEIYRQQEKMFVEMGRIWMTMICTEADGSISGLTEVRYNPSRDTIISQLMTGVISEYRGRGIGKWLKAAMLLKIREEFPKVKTITTGNANSNAPMLSINNRLGFKMHKESINAQIYVEKVAKYLNLS
ncbi:MAG TPA: GNAT family N-acetyltransferase [Candidatus Bathyarchaeia archaeon]|nr:GNAT family N-acetyltransferase [Candidatus Bathyarchaeia archaeon]